MPKIKRQIPRNDKGYNLNYQPPGPVTEAFMLDDRMYQYLKGPWGSGKSSVVCMKIFLRSCMQEPDPRDGIRRTRWAIIRNTYPELKSTTIKTFCYWFPEQYFGTMWWDIPITYLMKYRDVEAEIFFIAMDRPEHVKKLLSLELTGAWANECRELPKQVLDDLEGRIGRYPAMSEGGATWFGVMADTNPPDDDHWLYEMFEETPDLDPKKYVLYSQPSGLSPEAENKSNLRPGYYETMLINKSPSWVDVYVRGKWGTVHGDRLVYHEWDEARHLAKEPIIPNPNLPLFVGFDYGLTPACVLAQVTPRGKLLVLREIVSTSIAPDGIGVRQFIRTAVRWHLANEFSRYQLEVWGDPAGAHRAQTDEVTCEQILQEEGLDVRSPDTNSFIERREAVADYLNLAEGFLLDPSCKVLKRGFNKGYKYKRMRVGGKDFPVDRVDKIGNLTTHPHDALQYICLGIKHHTHIKKMNASIPNTSGPQYPLYSEADA